MQFVKSNLEPITITINEVEYPARLTFRALAELEELTHESFMTLFNRFAEGDFIIADILNILYVSLKYGGVEVTIDDIQEMDFSTEFFQGAMMEITKLLNRTQKVVSSIAEVNKGTGKSEKK